MPKILLIIPSFDPKRITGSGVRPAKMVEAFQGRFGKDNVIIASGCSKERRETYFNLDLSKIELAYLEASTAPLALTDKDHIPRNLFLEYFVFKKIIQNNGRAIVFYRDIRWKFEFFKKKHGLFKRWFSIIFHYVELLQYLLVGVEFAVPCKEMASMVPFFANKSVIELPPGGANTGGQRRLRFQPGQIKLLYIGGVTPPVYDIKPALKLVQNSNALELTICCRQPEWEQQKETYLKYISPNVNIVHASGEDLYQLYQMAHFLIDYRTPHAYNKFSMPLKIFESIGHCVPIITRPGTSYARFVAENKVGIVCDTEEEFTHAMLKFQKDHVSYDKLCFQVSKIAEQNTWQMRVERILSKY